MLTPIDRSSRDSKATTGLLILLAIIGALVAYKTGGAVRTMSQVSSVGTLSVREGILPLSTPEGLSAVSRTVNYLAVIWPAFAFGILISAAVRSFVPANALAGIFRRAPIRAQLAAGASGSPLMLCSCCVAPLFSAVYQRSARLGPSLALMVAAPALNPAALILTGMLFPLPITAARVVMSAVAVFAGTALVARVFGNSAGAMNVPDQGATGCEPAESSVAGFVKSCFYVAGRTVPVLLVGVVVAMAISQYRLESVITSSSGKAAAIALTALVAIPIALPTFFEVPLALALLTAGAPTGAAAALLFAGPVVNLPSLLTVGRSAGWKVAASLAGMVWIVAVAGALLVD